MAEAMGYHHPNEPKIRFCPEALVPALRDLAGESYPPSKPNAGLLGHGSRRQGASIFKDQEEETRIAPNTLLELVPMIRRMLTEKRRERVCCGLKFAAPYRLNRQRLDNEWSSETSFVGPRKDLAPRCWGMATLELTFQRFSEI